MRTTTEKMLLRQALPALLFFLLACSLLPGSAAPNEQGEHRFFIAAAAGYFYPGQDAFRKIYDKPAWPLELQLGWAAVPSLDLFVAARFMQVDGNTVLLDAQVPGESYALRLQLLALRLGARYMMGAGQIVPYFGAGIQYAFFKEKWLDVPLEASGNKAGFFVHGGGRLRLARALHLLAQLEYSHVPAGKGSGDERMNLGGLCLSLGVRAGVF